MERNDSQLITRADLADLLGVSSKTLRRWEIKGWLPSVRIGQHSNARYRMKDVKKLIQDLKVNKSQ